MSQEGKKDLAGKIVTWVGATFAGFLVFFVFLDFLLPLQFVGLVLFGWIGYLHRVVPQVRFNPEIAFDAILALSLALFGLHRILRWWARQRGAGSEKWRFGWTIKITTMVLLLFATALATGGMVHQIAWLCREKKVIEMVGKGKQTKELSNMKQVATAARLYAEDHEGRLPKLVDELYPDYLPVKSIWFSAPLDGEPPQPFIYYPGYSTREDPHTIILASPCPYESPHGRTRCVAYLDSAAAVLREPKFQEQLRLRRPPLRTP